DQRPGKKQCGGEHHRVPPPHKIGETAGEECADEASDQQRCDCKSEPIARRPASFDEPERSLQSRLRAVHRAAVVAEQEPADRGDGDDCADESHVRALRTYLHSLSPSTLSLPRHVSVNACLAKSNAEIVYPPAGPAESRITSSWSRIASCDVPVRPRRLSFSSPSKSSSAVAAIAETGWRIVVSSGHTVVAGAVSSKPTTLRSLGTSRPLRCASPTTAAAISSLLAKIAVGRFELPNSRSAASRPERKVK